MSSAANFSSVTEGECLRLQKQCASPRASLRASCVSPSIYLPLLLFDAASYACETKTSRMPSEAYTRQSETTSTITSKLFENFRCHFLKINFRYDVRFLTSTATYCIRSKSSSPFVQQKNRHLRPLELE